MSINPVQLELPDLVGLKEQAESLVLPSNDKVSLTGFGDKKSPFQSRGLDFQEVRVYQPGFLNCNTFFSIILDKKKAYTILYAF